jgi:hypothetical protein
MTKHFDERTCEQCAVVFSRRRGQFSKPGSGRFCSVQCRVATYTQEGSKRWKGGRRVSEEIKKCDVVCANCHAERTDRRRREKRGAK